MFYSSLRQKAKYLIYNDKYEANPYRLQKPKELYSKSFFDARTWVHDPKHFVSSGQIAHNPEQPKRVEVLSESAVNTYCTLERPTDFGMGPIGDIHSHRYLRFLQNVFIRWQKSVNSTGEVIPSIHPLLRYHSYPKSAIGQAGFHQADTSCPIGQHTWSSAYWSAQSAINLVQHMLDGAQHGYSLHRPPRHHAFAKVAGRFFLTILQLRRNISQNAGGGSPFWKSTSIMEMGPKGYSTIATISLRYRYMQIPKFYPFFWGQANWCGHGRGYGFNLNLPLARKTGDEGYLSTLRIVLDHIRCFGPDIIVVALGLDAAISDPFKGLSITTEGFGKIANNIGKLGKPLAIVQEGEYLGPELGLNLTRFLKAIKA